VDRVPTAPVPGGNALGNVLTVDDCVGDDTDDRGQHDDRDGDRHADVESRWLSATFRCCARR
jgi:hypothetical protein